MKKTLALSALTAMALTGFAYSQDDSEISTDFAVSYNTEYIFRGINVGDDLYTYGLDVAGSCDCGFDWSAGIWYAQFDLPGADEELDIYGEVSKDFGGFNVAVGFIRYIFPDGSDANNTEIYAGIGTEFYGLELGAKVFWNIDADNSSVFSNGDLYYELSAAYGYDISDKLSASIGATVGFFDADGNPNLGNGSDEGSGFAQVTITAGLSYAVSENLSLNPYIAYSTAESEYVTSFNPGSEDNNFYGGISVGYSF